MRHRWLAAVILIVLALGLTPATAEVVEIDPEKDPVQTLDQAESQRLATLQRTATPILASEVSPDDTTILHAVLRPGDEDLDISFLNIADGSTTPVSNLLGRLPPPGVVRAARRRFMLGLVVYADALALSWLSAPLALSLCGLMALYYAFDQASIPAEPEPRDQQSTGRSA